MRSIAQRQRKLKLMQQLNAPETWYAPGGLKLKPEFGAKYVMMIIEGVKRSMDRGITAMSQSMEQDML
jgi:hypothetical protein